MDDSPICLTSCLYILIPVPKTYPLSNFFIAIKLTVLSELQKTKHGLGEFTPSRGEEEELHQ